MWGRKYYEVPTPIKQSKCDLKFHFLKRNIYSSLDLSNRFSPVKSQGTIGSCAIFSIVSVFEYFMKRSRLLSENDMLSERFLYYQTLLTTYKCIPKHFPGVSIHDALKTSVEYGICSEHLFPYYQNSYQSLSGKIELNPPPKEAYLDAKKYRVSGYGQLIFNTPNDHLNQIRYCISMEIPIITVFDGGDGSIGWKTQYYDGIINRPKKKEWKHCVVITGYDEEKKLLRFRNSWSGSFVEWGDEGHGYFNYSDIDLLCESYIITGVRIRNDNNTQLGIQRILNSEQVNLF